MDSPITSTSSQSKAARSSSSLINDEKGYETDLSVESTDTEVNKDTSDWSERERGGEEEIVTYD